MSDTFIVELMVPVKITAKTLIDCTQVHVLDAYVQNDKGGTHISFLGEKAYLHALDQIAAEARDRDRRDRDARR